MNKWLQNKKIRASVWLLKSAGIYVPIEDENISEFKIDSIEDLKGGRIKIVAHNDKRGFMQTMVIGIEELIETYNSVRKSVSLNLYTSRAIIKDRKGNEWNL